MISLTLASCVHETDTGKGDTDTSPAYTLLVSEPIGAVALDVGPDPGDASLLDNVCVLDSVGAVRCAGGVPEPDVSEVFSSISIGEEGGCGVLTAGGASCWGKFPDIATHDLSAVTAISIYYDDEVCAGDGTDAWCQTAGMGVEEEWVGVGAVQIDAYMFGMVFQDAADALWYSVGTEFYPVDTESSEPVVSWNGNSGNSVVFVTVDGVLAETDLVPVSLDFPVVWRADDVRYASQTVDPALATGRCWIRNDGKIDFPWEDYFGDARYDPTLVEEDYEFVAVGCAGTLEPWAITGDGRVARLVWESAPEMPF